MVASELLVVWSYIALGVVVWVAGGLGGYIRYVDYDANDNVHES